MTPDKRKTALLIISLLNTIAVFSCSSNPGYRSAARSDLFEPHEVAGVLPEYRLGFGDVVEIKFFRNSQFNESLKVRPDGRISLAKVGELQVNGMTPSQLDSVVTSVYAEFIRDPDVTVIVREFAGYKFYVLGEVGSPGGYPVERNMTILQAIASAGGPKLSAKLNSVAIIRRAQGTDIEARIFDLSKTLNDDPRRILENDIFIQPHDIIYVPKTAIASVSDFMGQLYSGFLPPLDLYLRAVLFYDR